jgi:predicted MFS family arabinose efflux permease
MVAAPPLYALIGIAGLFAGTGLLALAAIPLVLWVVPAAPPREAARADGGWRMVAFSPELQRLNFGVFILNLTLMAVFVVVPVLLVERGGLPLPSHWQVYLPTVLVSFALMLPPLLAAERRGLVRQVFLLGIGLLAIVMLGFAWFAPSLIALAFWLLAFFVGFNILEAMQPSQVSRMAPPNAKGLALGIYNTTQSVGLGAGGVGAGWVVDHYGRTGVFVGSAVLLLVWLVVALWTRAPAPRATAAV